MGRMMSDRSCDRSIARRQRRRHTYDTAAVVDGGLPVLRRAFTLVELLVVVAIIALLLGILLPALGKARDISRLSACGSNLRQLGVATRTYAADFQDRIPAGPAGDSFFGRPWTQVNGAGIWIGNPLNTYMAHGLLLDEHLGNNTKTLECPGDDTNSPADELAKIGTTDNALASYAYRHLSQTTSDKLTDLGVNGVGSAARALFMDTESYGPKAAGQYHSAHNGETVNIAYLDAHVESVANTDGVLAIREEDFADIAGVLDRGDQVFVNADHAENGNAAGAPPLP